MATIWESRTKQGTATTNNTFTGTTLSSWSRQQKLAMIASFALLGILLAVSACSKQSAKTAPGSISGPVASATANPVGTPAIQTLAANSQAPATQVAVAKVKKTPKKRPANVTFRDANSGVSFVYPRKFELASGEDAQPEVADNTLNKASVPMDFVEKGGVTVATVALPNESYPGTDFELGFFSVNVNRSISEQECPHFAFVDTSNPDGEPIDAEKVKVGSADGAREMEMTSEFEGDATKQMETQYYHSYENGACYEYVLGLGTGGYGVKEGLKPVDRDEVFARLEKILTTVKITPTAQEQKEKEQEPAAQAPAAEGTATTADATN